MPTDFLLFGSSRISYSRWGTGNQLLLCFHGYGETAASFAFLEPALGKEFTILAIDLPFHGGTEWNDGTYFDPDQLPELIGQIIAALPLAPAPPPARDLPLTRDQPVSPDRWWLLGYSMGGRVALSLLERVPKKIARIVLLAPDGLRMNRWYWLATQSRPGNRLFRWAMQHPAGFFFLLRIANRMKWINPGVYKFIFRYIDDVQVRDQLYKRWTTMRGFRTDTLKLRSLIREHHIPVRLVYGQHDRIIRAETGARFLKGIGTWCEIEILDSGHALLQAKYLDRLKAMLED